MTLCETIQRSYDQHFKNTDTIQSSVKMILLVDPQIILDLTHHYNISVIAYGSFLGKKKNK